MSQGPSILFLGPSRRSSDSLHSPCTLNTVPSTHLSTMAHIQCIRPVTLPLRSTSSTPNNCSSLVILTLISSPSSTAGSCTVYPIFRIYRLPSWFACLSSSPICRRVRGHRWVSGHQLSVPLASLYELTGSKFLLENVMIHSESLDISLMFAD